MMLVKAVVVVAAAVVVVGIVGRNQARVRRDGCHSPFRC